MDEGVRIALIDDYHKRLPELFPNRHLHATFHTIAESQLAMRLPEVEAALKRLMAEGLDRHQALHAICSELAVQIYNTLSDVKPGTQDAKPGTQFDNARYYRALSELTAEKWWAVAEPEKPPAGVIRPGGRRRRKRR